MKYNVEDLIPHRSRMIMIDDFLDVGYNEAVSLTSVKLSWPMADEDGVDILAIIETAAQTSAAIGAWRVNDNEGEDHFGFIAGIKSARLLQSRIPIGRELVSSAKCPHLLDADGIAYGLFRCEIQDDESVIAEINLQLLRPPEARLDELYPGTPEAQYVSSSESSLSKPWSSIESIIVMDSGLIEAKFAPPIDSPWCDGHFPGRPLLPGAALIHMVYKALFESLLSDGKVVGITGIKRVKFKKPALPGRLLTAQIKPAAQSPGLEYAFDLSCEGESMCAGILILEEDAK